MAQDNLGQDHALPDLHLCNNYRHLLFALASIAASGRVATLIYLEDRLPIPADLRSRVVAACPQVEMIFTRDATQMADFIRLPRLFPAIFRRNLTLGQPWGLRRVRAWTPPLLADRRFATGYLYHSGFFLSKAVAGLCQRVVMRESGLNNYTALAVSPLKALLRLVSGLSPQRQIWGEERWIDRIEVSHPEDLPAAVQAKAQRLTFAEVMDALPAATAHSIAAAFLGQTPVIAAARTALLLTQPLDQINICSPDEKLRLYGGIAQTLTAAGYQVYIKPHPLEADMVIAGCVTLPPAFPVEAWPYFSEQKFNLAIALCSSSLVSGARAFSAQTLQLIAPDDFNPRGFARWPATIKAALLQAGLS